MVAFYKKITVFCEYPWQTEVDYRYIAFSTKNGKKFNKFIFLTLSVEVPFTERLERVQEVNPKITYLNKV